MKPEHLRVARPTSSIESVLDFYRDGLGLEVISSFENHDGFDGVMLGRPDASYHLEFTSESDVIPPPAPTKENLLVFYLPDPDQFQASVERMKSRGHQPVPSHNPYWDEIGVTFEDADGYRVVLANRAWS